MSWIRNTLIHPTKSESDLYCIIRKKYLKPAVFKTVLNASIKVSGIQKFSFFYSNVEI